MQKKSTRLKTGICLYECNTKHEIFMNISNEAFFQTNNYPKPYPGDLNQCNITFTFDGPNEDVMIFVFKTELFYDEKGTIFKNSTTFEPLYVSSHSFKDHYTKKNDISYTSYAQFGYISFESKNTPRCVLETNTPIFLLNEYMMIPIQSDYVYIPLLSDSCHWKFATSKEYGFKVVIQYFEPTLINELYIRNSTDMFVNHRSAKIAHPYYNSDSYLQIDIYKNTNLTLRAFTAYITVVKKIKPITNICSHEADSWGNVVWNINTQPHFLNVYCSFDLIISNTSIEYDVKVDEFNIEKNVDFLRYTYDDVNEQNFTVYIQLPAVLPINDGFTGELLYFTLLGYPNGSKKHYFWEFGLDGSIQTAATYVSFNKIECHCIGTSIPCTADGADQPTGIMDRDNFRYCGNLKCKFTIEPCLTKIRAKSSAGFTVMQLKVNRKFYDRTIQIESNNDIFTVYADGIVALHLELNTFNRYENDYVFFLNNSKTNVFEATTYPSRLSKVLSLATSRLINPPDVYEIFLTLDVPFAVIDTGLHYSNIIKVQNVQNSKGFVIYSNTKHGVLLFEDENLLVSYGSTTCFGSVHPYICNITSNKFAMYFPDRILPYPFLLIQSSNSVQKGCVFNQNIFITKEIIHLPIAIIANSEDICVSTLLIVYDVWLPNYYYISSYWTSSKNENVQIFAGTDSLYFEFNSKTSNKYTRIELFSFLYTIKVPKNSAIYLQLTEVVPHIDDMFQDIHVSVVPTIAITFGNYVSLISTAHYGTSKDSLGFKETYYCFPFRKLKFTTIYFENDPSEKFYFTFKNDITRVDEIGETFIFDNRISKNQTSNFECVHLQYCPVINLSPAKNGIIFKVETVEDVSHKNNTMILK